MTVTAKDQVKKSPMDYQNFETAYEKACRQADVIHGQEQDRRHRLRTVLLEDDLEDLNYQLEQDDERIEELELLAQDLQDELDVRVQSSEDASRELKIRSREVEVLKMEISSLNGLSTDSAKLLSEKLALSRELNSLRPEVDHLRSLASSQQELLSEKLSLQRQITTLELELENERRSTKRLSEREGREKREDAQLEASLDAARAELAKEKRERQKADREHQKSSMELQNRVTTLESRLENFRTKLRSTKDALQEAQGDLQKARAAKPPSAPTTTALSAPMATKGRKRAASEIHADTMIGTPGDLPAVKRNRVNQSLPGEKSTFSITPFLNRTTSIAPEEDVRNVENEEDKENATKEPASPSRPNGSNGTILKNSRRANAKANMPDDPADCADRKSKPKGDRDRTSATKFAPTKAAPARKAIAAAPKLAKVTEEDDSNSCSTEGTIENTAKPSTTDLLEQPNLEATKVEKKKRKLLGGGLGKTLFDEDEGEGLGGGRKAATASRGLIALGRGGTGAPRLGQKATTGFGAISPLKKERRAAVA